ncbi:hypothetical protein H5P28_11870 [Ruficoccus amylovorans]|uniref:Uncharacterized protein n=1 Tax=Ruficoccus amylovorans TaxID=1804625 RepID=A0A842HEE7_9BACT|nr:hypothetical protein [Ruficoccus amylovorans]MBC2594955.1 hypothetical protein [Ruficoccus amylovorans]
MTVGDIEDMLAAPLGVESVSELPQSSRNRIRSVVNGVLSRIYAPEDGSRPKWSERNRGYRMPAPKSVTLTVTEGAATFTAVGHTFDNSQAGCVIKTGESWYNYAGKDGSNADCFTQPYNGPSGTVEGTVYFCCATLENDVVGVIGVPQAVGIGPLEAISGVDEQTLYRAYWTADFTDLRNYYRAYDYPRRTFERGNEYDLGDPYFYFIDDAAFSPLANLSVSKRLFIYPLPDVAVSIQLRVNVVPQVASDADQIPLPPGVNDSVFRALAQESMANVFEDYPVSNVQGLQVEAARGRAQIKSLSKTQRVRKGTLRMPPGW